MNCAPPSYSTPSITSNVSAASAPPAPPARMRAKGAKGAKGVVRLLAAAAAASLAGSVFAQASFVAGGGGAVRKLPEVLSQQQVTNIANTQIQNITGPQIQQILQTQNFANQTINQLLQNQNITNQQIQDLRSFSNIIDARVTQVFTQQGVTDADLAALRAWMLGELGKLSQPQLPGAPPGQPPAPGAPPGQPGADDVAYSVEHGVVCGGKDGVQAADQPLVMTAYWKASNTKWYFTDTMFYAVGDVRSLQPGQYRVGSLVLGDRLPLTPRGGFCTVRLS